MRCHVIALSLLVLSGTTKCEISAAKFGQCAVCCVVAGGALYLMLEKSESKKGGESSTNTTPTTKSDTGTNTNSTAQSGAGATTTASAGTTGSTSNTNTNPNPLSTTSPLFQALVHSSWCGTKSTRTCSNRWYRYVNPAKPLHPDADGLISFVQDHRNSEPTTPLHHRVYFCARDTNCTDYPDWDNLAGLVVRDADAEKRMLCAMLAIKALSQQCKCDVYGDLHQQCEGMVRGSNDLRNHRVVGDFNPMTPARDLPGDNKEVYESVAGKDSAELAARVICKDIRTNKPEALCIIYRYAKDRYEVCQATNATRFFRKK